MSKEEFEKNVRLPLIHNQEDLLNFAYECYQLGLKESQEESGEKSKIDDK